MTTYAVPPIDPMSIRFQGTDALVPEGPVLTRRLSDLPGLFARDDERAAEAAREDRVVYTVSSSPVPELPRELPQSITTIQPGTVAGEFYMTKGHQHPDPQGEIYLGLRGVGGLLMFDGETTRWVDMAEGVIGYIPPGWAHRSVNVGDEPYSFLAVYPGSAGHDYQWVLDHGMGRRAVARAGGHELVPYTSPTAQS
jgi:glucose-6-phosphate isomerase, archaeal